jgi:hypothetical protein
MTVEEYGNLVDDLAYARSKYARLYNKTKGLRSLLVDAVKRMESAECQEASAEMLAVAKDELAVSQMTLDCG